METADGTGQPLVVDQFNLLSSVSDNVRDDGTFLPTIPEVVSIQPSSIVDHVCQVSPANLPTLELGELGGSIRANSQELTRILTCVGEYFSKAGGSASNTLRGLAGFGVAARMLGARDKDEWGALFVSSMKRAGVDTSKIITRDDGSTGRCCIVSCEGQRTMRTCLDGAARLQPEELKAEEFQGIKWVYLSGYCFYTPGLLERAVDLAHGAGTSVALELGSFEIVRTFKSNLLSVLQQGKISLCFCNEDEAKELVSDNSGSGATPEEGLKELAGYCRIAAVVTLGPEGCIVLRNGTDENIVRQNAFIVSNVVDTTGAGDIFAAGFLYALIRGMDIARAAEIGCLAGAAVVQTLGAEMTQTTWSWLHAHMHGPLAGEAVRVSAEQVQQELLRCYALIEKVGRGVVYYGSARLQANSPHYIKARELGGRIATLLDTSATWSGGGPGLMMAATQGAMDVNKPAAGIRIAREAGTTVRSASYLPEDSYVICRFLSSRKVALVDSAMRNSEEDRTALVFLPGGLGTMDELFEVMTLVQLKKLGSRLPVPLLVVNYGGFFNGLLDFLAECDALGTIGVAELEGLLVVDSNEAAVRALSQFYNLQCDDDDGVLNKGSILKGSEWAAYRQQQR